MGKRALKQNREFKFDPFDDFDEIYDAGFDFKDITGDFDPSEWGDEVREKGRVNARRKIERRNEMKKLYSELNDWEEFGESESWHIQ